MPRHDFRCTNDECGYLQSDLMVSITQIDCQQCPKCGSQMHTTFEHWGRATIDDGLLVPSARGYWNSAGRSFQTKKELREWCKANNKICPYLEGDPNKNWRMSKRSREFAIFCAKQDKLKAEGVPEETRLAEMERREDHYAPGTQWW